MQCHGGDNTNSISSPRREGPGKGHRGRVKGLDHNSLVAACRLTGYDVVYRNNRDGFSPIEQINPDTVDLSLIHI